MTNNLRASVKHNNIITINIDMISIFKKKLHKIIVDKTITTSINSSSPHI